MIRTLSENDSKKAIHDPEMIERQHVVPSNVIVIERLFCSHFTTRVLNSYCTDYLYSVQIICIAMETHNALQPYACVLCPLSKLLEIRRLESQGYF